METRKKQQSYPLIRCNKYLYQKNIPLPIPSQPEKPELAPLKYEKAAESFNLNCTYGIYICMGLYIILALTGDSDATMNFVVLLSFIFILIIIAYFISKENLEKIVRKNDKIRESNDEIINSYQLKCEEINKKVEKFKTVNNNPEQLKKVNSKIKEILITKVTLPFDYPAIKKGTTESFFEKVLELLLDTYKLDPLKILKNKALKPDYFDENAKPYQPDICLFYEDKKYYIDIEIDEPYDLESKTPIHYLSDELHINITRDNYFVKEANWTVIRLTEESIVNFPIHSGLYCFWYAAALMENIQLTQTIRSLNVKLLKNEDSLMSLEDIIRVKCWTKSQAEDYAQNNYRESYLKRLNDYSFSRL